MAFFQRPAAAPAAPGGAALARAGPLGATAVPDGPTCPSEAGAGGGRRRQDC